MSGDLSIHNPPPLRSPGFTRAGPHSLLEHAQQRLELVTRERDMHVLRYNQLSDMYEATLERLADENHDLRAQVLGLRAEIERMLHLAGPFEA